MGKKNDINNIKTNVQAERDILMDNSTIDNSIQIIKDSYNTYNVVIQNVNVINALAGESTKVAYERNILKSLANITTNLQRVIGIIKNIRYDHEKKKVCLYVGNVFWSNVYITNHLVIPLAKHKLDKLVGDGFKKGQNIYFNAKIYSYPSSDNNQYLKYGLEFVNLIQCFGPMLNKKIYADDRVTKIPLFNLSRECKYDYIKTPEQRDLLKLINRIQTITLDYTDLPQNFFINILLNIHFAEHYEKMMIAHQNDYNYLCDANKSIYEPMYWLMYILEIMESRDPYIVMCFLVQMYNRSLSNMILTMSKESLIDKSDIRNILNIGYKNIDKLNDFDKLYNNLFETMNKIK